MIKIQEAKKIIEEADKVVIGAGAGLSAAAGLTYSGPRFEVFFKDYIVRYGMQDMYSAAFYPFETAEERWGYWAKHIYHNRYQPEGLSLYRDLFDLVKDKDYFVITTNVDGQFMKTGFAPERFFEVQGNYGEWQCSVPCRQKVFDNRGAVMEMLNEIKDLKIPTDLIPYCPHCGAPMTMHLRVDQAFVQNETWEASYEAYLGFLEGMEDQKVVFLELGVGYNTPTIIRYPFEKMTACPLSSTGDSRLSLPTRPLFTRKTIRKRSCRLKRLDSDSAQSLPVARRYHSSGG